MAKIIQKSTGALIYRLKDGIGNYSQADWIEVKIIDPNNTTIKVATPHYLGSGVYQYVLETTMTVQAGRYEAHWQAKKDTADITDIEIFDVVRSDAEYMVSVADVQEFTGSVEPESLIRQLIFAFQGFAENYCQVKFRPTGIIDERHSGDNTRTLLVGNYPLLDITKVEVYGQFVIPERNLNAGTIEGFVADFDTGLIELTSSYMFYKGSNNVLISYCYGYDNIPADLKMAAMEWVSFKLRHRDSLGLKGEGLGPYKVEYDDSYIPNNIKDVLNNYKRGFGV
ncbi:hypothetical protein KJ628_05995 [Patescibacteria group bacterium]|nr:hypothetical protein [Patescibacteria group bacterium]